MADDSLVAQFTALTGAPAERARFFLDSAGGDVNAAVSLFYDAPDMTGDAPMIPDDVVDAPSTARTAPMSADTPLPAPAPAVASSAPSGPRTLGGEGTESVAVDSPWPSQQAQQQPRSGSGSRGGASSRGFATLGDFARPAPSARGGGGSGGPRIGRLQHNDDDDDSSGDEGGPPGGAGDDPLEFFTGGGRGSGLSVENPNAGQGQGQGGANSDLIRDILRKAAQAGQAPLRGAGSPGRGGDGPSTSSSFFGGSGHTLGGADDGGADDEPTAPASSSMPGAFGAPQTEDDADEEDVAVRRLTFWRNGFTVGEDDSELMSYDNPTHAELLRLVQSGRAPPSLLGVRPGQPVELHVARRTDEDYKAPPARPFGGQGNRLGAPTPEMASSSSSSFAAPPPQQPASEPQSVNVKFEVDPSQPTTNLQIRLRDGQRVVGRFNHSHTVADVRNYVRASTTTPQGEFVLTSAFPPVELKDESVSLKDAGLLGAVVIVKGV